MLLENFRFVIKLVESINWEVIFTDIKNVKLVESIILWSPERKLWDYHHFSFPAYIINLCCGISQTSVLYCYQLLETE